jgi:hypothetical protein
MTSDTRGQDAEADAINDRMARQIEERRRRIPNRRKASSGAAPQQERRRICTYCFQVGDHQTAAQCLRALERV